MNKKDKKVINKNYRLITKLNNDIIEQPKSNKPYNNIFDQFGNYSFPTELKKNNLIQCTTNLNFIIFYQSK